jgi:hypothetical protein
VGEGVTARLKADENHNGTVVGKQSGEHRKVPGEST